MAVKASVECLNNHSDDQGIEQARYYYCRYATLRFMDYYYQRVPKEYRKSFLKEYLRVMHNLGHFPIMKENDNLIRFCMNHKVFERQRVQLFALAMKYKKQTRPKIKRLRTKTKKSTSKMTSLLPKGGSSASQSQESLQCDVLFMGFDNRYTGNSRYLFESLCRSEFGKTHTILFATQSELIDETYRVIPASTEYQKAYNSAKVVVFESWINLGLKKRPGSVWVQLWHGLPIKKMLFDSNEYEVSPIIKKQADSF